MLHADVIAALQLATGPVILVSAIGLLLLTMNNRLAHGVDRARKLISSLQTTDPVTRKSIEAQLAIIWQRLVLIRSAIECAVGSALFSAILVILLFMGAAFRVSAPFAIGGVVILSLGCLILSLTLLIIEIRWALSALRLDFQASDLFK